VPTAWHPFSSYFDVWIALGCNDLVQMSIPGNAVEGHGSLPPWCESGSSYAATMKLNGSSKRRFHSVRAPQPPCQEPNQIDGRSMMGTFGTGSRRHPVAHLGEGAANG